MEIVDIFEVVEGSLYSVLFEAESNAVDDNDTIIPVGQLHEFRRLFDLWNDPIRLREFFTAHEKDLNEDYWDGISIDEAIEKTRAEAKVLEAVLLEYAEAGKTERLKNLSMIFKPLSDGKIEKEYEKDKAKVGGKKTWLRLYAIRIDANFFVVCGGAIKLRKTLNDRKYLLKELEKIEITRDYLKDEDSDVLDFYEIR